MKTFRILLASTFVGAALLTAVIPAGAESYDTSDDTVTVTTNDGGALTPGVDFSVSASGFQQVSQVQVYFKPGPVFLGTLTTNSVGTVTGSFSIPTDAAAGEHEIELQGIDAAGNPRVLGYSVTVVGNGAADNTVNQLSFTGSTALPLVALGTVLTVMGVTTMRFRRRRLGIA